MCQKSPKVPEEATQKGSHQPNVGLKNFRRASAPHFSESIQQPLRCLRRTMTQRRTRKSTSKVLALTALLRDPLSLAAVPAAANKRSKKKSTPAVSTAARTASRTGTVAARNAGLMLAVDPKYREQHILPHSIARARKTRYNLSIEPTASAASPTPSSDVCAEVDPEPAIETEVADANVEADSDAESDAEMIDQRQRCDIGCTRRTILYFLFMSCLCLFVFCFALLF